MIGKMIMLTTIAMLAWTTIAKMNDVDGDGDDDNLAGTRVEGEDRGRRSLFPPSGFSDKSIILIIFTDAFSTADCCPLLTICPRCCFRHAPDADIKDCL